jgi:hypothetical protein
VPGAEGVEQGERGAQKIAEPRRVHRADRIRDWMAVGLVIVGAIVYGAAHAGMGSLARDRTPTTTEQAARGEWKMVRWNRFDRLSRVGVGLVLAGAAVSILSFARHMARRKARSHAA